MPFAVTHILTSIIIVDIIRDHLVKKKFSLNYVYLAGFAGLLPDIDYVIYLLLRLFFRVDINFIHRTFTHNLVLPAVLVLIALIVKKWDSKGSLALFVVATGWTIHVLLDFLIIGEVNLLYPVGSMIVGLNIASLFGDVVIFLSSLDAILLVLWLFYMEKKNMIKDFI